MRWKQIYISECSVSVCSKILDHASLEEDRIFVIKTRNVSITVPELYENKEFCLTYSGKITSIPCVLALEQCLVHMHSDFFIFWMRNPFSLFKECSESLANCVVAFCFVSIQALLGFTWICLSLLEKDWYLKIFCYDKFLIHTENLTPSTLHSQKHKLI